MKKNERVKDRFSRMHLFWTIQRRRIEHRLMLLGDRIEYSNDHRKEVANFNNPFNP
jgi:hypothetical protein